MATRLEQVLRVGQSEQLRRTSAVMSVSASANCGISTIETEPTGTIDPSIKKKVSEKAMGKALAAKATEQAAIEAWLAPAPLPEPVFGADSLPVYVAVHAVGHRWAAGIALDKIRHTQLPTVRPNGDVILHITPTGDAFALKQAEIVRKRNPNHKEFAFHFQPQFVAIEPNPADPKPVDPNKTMAHLSWLEFTSDEKKEICQKVDRVESSYKATYPGEAHIVLTVVANDGPYADLSVYVEPLKEPLRSTSNKELGTRPNMLAISRTDFCGQSDTVFVGPRRVL